MVKIVYKYINEFINEEQLINSLEQFCSENNKYEEQIKQLIDMIKNIINEFQNNSILKYDKIYNLLLNNEIYLELFYQMSADDLMLMITDYIKARLVPTLDQKTFDAVVDAAINSGKQSKEKCWRLAMNYENSDLNFDKIEDYLISTKDVWFVVEYMTGPIESIDYDRFICKIIDTNDKEFIERIIKDDLTCTVLDENQINKLKALL